MQRHFFTLDVFTDRRFCGNPLAVVLDAGGLDDAAMQTVAREFNLPETVFVLPADDSAHRARLRIFTPGVELPFAGHPTVGTAVLLARLDGVSTGELVLEEKIGPVRCTVEAVDSERGRARFALPRQPEEVAPRPDAERVAAALGLSAEDIGCGAYRMGNWSAGVPLTFVPVRDLAAVRRSRPVMTVWDNAFGGANPPAAYVFCCDSVEPGHAYHARMFAPGLGIAEDPATGSGVAALAGLAARYGGLGDGTHRLTVEQGYEMGRPSQLDLTLSIRGGALTEAAIGGAAVLVGEGRLEA